MSQSYRPKEQTDWTDVRDRIEDEGYRQVRTEKVYEDDVIGIDRYIFEHEEDASDRFAATVKVDPGLQNPGPAVLTSVQEIDRMYFVVRDDNTIEINPNSPSDQPNLQLRINHEGVTTELTENGEVVASQARRFDEFVDDLQNGPDETLPMDEPNEQYGYGIYNTHENCFVAIGQYLEDTTGRYTEDDLASSEEEIIRAFNGLSEDHNFGDMDHLRVVRVQLENDLDQQAAESVKTDEQPEIDVSP